MMKESQGTLGVSGRGTGKVLRVELCGHWALRKNAPALLGSLERRRARSLWPADFAGLAITAIYLVK